MLFQQRMSERIRTDRRTRGRCDEKEHKCNKKRIETAAKLRNNNDQMRERQMKITFSNVYNNITKPNQPTLIVQL